MSLMGKVVCKVVAKDNVNPNLNDHIVKTLREKNKYVYEQKEEFDFSVIDVAGTPMERLCSKNADPNKIILYFHGGAYLHKLHNRHRSVAEYFAKKTDYVIYMPNYRVAPEDRYPSALEDGEKCYDYLLSSGFDPKKIAFMGDSAGGNLALALMLKLRDENKPLPFTALLFSPWADMLASGETYRTLYSTDLLFGEKGKTLDESNREKLLDSDIFLYCKDADRTSPYVSPVYGEYDGFPRMAIVAAKNEMLLADTLTIAEKLKKTGVEPALMIKHKMFHDYLLAIKYCREAKQAANFAIKFMKSVETRDN